MMKPAIVLTAALVSGMSLALDAQSSTAAADPVVSAAHSQADQSAAASAQTANGASSAKVSPMAYDYMRPVTCELAGKLDSKSAKVGDAVVTRTTESLRLADGSVIPKGARLVGHITAVQAHTSGQPDSHLAIAFDRAEWSGGHSIAILSVIQAVSPPVNPFASASAQNDNSLAGPIGGSPGMGGARGGGGGMAGGVAGAATSTTGGLGATAPGALRTTGQTAGDVTGNMGPVASIGVSPATSASMGLHSTAVPGVMLSGDPSGATAGTLSASRHNVHLDGGTQFTIALTRAPSQ